MPRTGATRPDPGGPADPPPTPVRIRPATPADAGRIAQLHVDGIDQGFLSLLGPRFLRRLYRRICLHPGSFLVVATGDDRAGPSEVVGFVAGSVDVPGLYHSFLARDGLAAGLPALGHLVSRWRRVIETLRHGSREGDGTGRGAELLAIAVDRAWRGRGAGERLVGAFLDELSRRSVAEAHVVVGADNRAAIGLYRRAGFVEARRFELHPGTESLLLQWDRGGGGGPRPPVGSPAP
jgi:ribosomal protein S18 acetylase RimI-like enzyme